MNTPGTSSWTSNTMGTLTALAPAKVNLTLEVLGKRPDGYHAIETLMVAINLCDRLEFRLSRSDLLLECNRPEIPTDNRNLVWKATEALRQATGCPQGAEIRLTKRIPHEAGLGGGSSDAATTLVALNELWQLKLSLAELSRIGGTVGSDVPFFVLATQHPAGWCTGRGEVVEPESLGVPLHIVVVKPANVGLSTREVYQRVAVPQQPAESTLARQALRSGDLLSLSRVLMNRLQAPAFTVAPVVESLFRELTALNPLACQLSGSGSALFALCRDAEEAARIATAIQSSTQFIPSSREVFACRSWHSEPFPSEDRHLSPQRGV
jgi:4-diphosphocytidyl-2-C-methyl-D-erythritol kinase